MDWSEELEVERPYCDWSGGRNGCWALVTSSLAVSPSVVVILMDPGGWEDASLASRHLLQHTQRYSTYQEEEECLICSEDLTPFFPPDH